VVPHNFHIVPRDPYSFSNMTSVRADIVGAPKVDYQETRLRTYSNRFSSSHVLEHYSSRHSQGDNSTLLDASKMQFLSLVATLVTRECHNHPHS